MSTPDNHDKKASQSAVFKSLTMVQNANDCCYDGACSSSPTLSEDVSDTRYNWEVSGMDYATCVRKVKDTVRQLADVNQVQVLFAIEKLVVDADNDIRAQVESAVQKTGYSLRDEQTTDEPQASRLRENLPLVTLIVMMTTSWGLEQSNHSFRQLAFIATTLIGLYPIARQASRLIKSGNYFAIETLMSVTAIGALFIGTTAEAAMVLLLFLIDERLKGWAASRMCQGVSALMALKPETATRLRSGERKEVAINSLWPGDVIEVAASECLPADGKLLSPFASFDESALTGESIPVERATGDKVPAGAASIDRLVTLEVLSKPGASVIDQILKLIREAEERHAPIERFINRFSRTYTPAIIIVALLVALVPPLLFVVNRQKWIYRGLTLLLIGCPCTLVISTPAAITSGLATAACCRTLIKGEAALEQLGRVAQVVFDRTGALTAGKPRVTAIHPAANISESELLTLAAAVKQGATHPLAQTIVREAQVAALAIPAVELQRALAGSGIEARASGERVLIYAAGKHPADAFAGLINELENTGQTVVLVVRNDDVLDIIVLQDTLCADAATAISELSALGIRGVVLTDDNPHAAAVIAGELGLEFKAGLLPEDKVKAMAELNRHAPLAVVGDSISDAPAMRAATIGTTMGSGADVALETVGAALIHSHLRGLVQMIELARATHTNIHQGITIVLGLKGIFLITTLLGMTGLWLTVLADVGTMVLVTANTLRLLRRR